MWIKAARKVVEEHSCLCVNEHGETRPWDEKVPKGFTLLDAVTARMLVLVHDALSDKAKTKFEEMDLLKAVNIGWKCIK